MCVRITVVDPGEISKLISLIYFCFLINGNFEKKTGLCQNLKNEYIFTCHIIFWIILMKTVSFIYNAQILKLRIFNKIYTQTINIKICKFTIKLGIKLILYVRIKHWWEIYKFDNLEWFYIRLIVELSCVNQFSRCC